DLHHSLAYRGLVDSLEKGNIAQVSEYFDLIERSTSRLNSVGFPGFSRSTQLENLLFSAAKHYAKALPLLQRRKLSSVIAIMNQNTLDEEMLPESPYLQELKDSGENLAVRIEYARTVANQHSEIEEEIEEKEDRLQDLDKVINSSIKQFQLVTEDFQEFLGYRDFLAPSQLTSIKLYGGGVLKDLPQILAVRDNIMTLESLKDLLEKTGGGVKVSGPQEFQRTLKRIRTSSMELSNTYNNSIKEQEKLRSEIVTLRTTSLNIRHEIQETLSKLIILYTYSRPQPLTDLLFSGWMI
ncbi:MAG: hypothetical protein KDD55_12020, partial [Bdellovibrionales bacterium]|nr:hypothetical protein [Bdellovibrionales bacterium]